jgi:hypothetical protein
MAASFLLLFLVSILLMQRRDISFQPLASSVYSCLDRWFW